MSILDEHELETGTKKMCTRLLLLLLFPLLYAQC